MGEFTKCPGSQCKVRFRCYRYLVPDERATGYMDYSITLLDISDMGCCMFVALDEQSEYVREKIQ